MAEIPYPFREYFKNLMLFTLWNSTSTPDVDKLLSYIVHDLMVLRGGGLLIDIPNEGNS